MYTLINNIKKVLGLLATAVCFIMTVVLTSCEKVSPTGVLIAGTGVEDRVLMSNQYFKNYMGDMEIFAAEGDEYTFLVGADSHVTTDCGRMEEMFQIGLDGNDLLYAHLGDIADTKAEYYINLDQCIHSAKLNYAEKKYEKIEIRDPNDSTEVLEVMYVDTLRDLVYSEVDDIKFPFFPVVGNHDITHNGWALWSNLFHSSFYDFYVVCDDGSADLILDHFIFLDTANGTLGKEQVRLIEEGVMDDRAMEEYGIRTRNTFVFSHTNIFRPQSFQFSSTFAREETFFLLNQLKEWNATIVFCGHVHKWEEDTVGGVLYLTLDSMSERNSPEEGDYLVRVHVKKDGTCSWEKVHMSYVAKE